MKLPISLVLAVQFSTYTQISNAEDASKAVTPTSTPAAVHEKSTAMAMSASPASQGGEEVSKKDLMDIAFKQIDFEARRLDRLISNAKTVGEILAAFVLAFAAIVSFLGIRSLSELKKELHSSVGGYVKSALRDQSLTKADSMNWLVI